MRDKKTWFARCLAAGWLREGPSWGLGTCASTACCCRGALQAWIPALSSWHHLGAFCCFCTPWAAVRRGSSFAFHPGGSSRGMHFVVGSCGWGNFAPPVPVPPVSGVPRRVSAAGFLRWVEL